MRIDGLKCQDCLSSVEGQSNVSSESAAVNISREGLEEALHSPNPQPSGYGSPYRAGTQSPSNRLTPTEKSFPMQMPTRVQRLVIHINATQTL